VIIIFVLVLIWSLYDFFNPAWWLARPKGRDFFAILWSQITPNLNAGPITLLTSNLLTLKEDRCRQAMTLDVMHVNGVYINLTLYLSADARVTVDYNGVYKTGTHFAHSIISNNNLE